MKAFLRAAGVLMLALLILAGANPKAVQALVSFIPPLDLRYDLGSSAKRFKEAYVGNLIVSGTYQVDDFHVVNSTIEDELTVGGAAVFNTTVNTTGLLTADNATINGTTATATFTASSTGNFTGTLTSNAFVGNSTANVTGLTTLNNATVNTTKTLTVGGPLILGTETITANTTVTATCATVYRVTDLPNGGNILVTFNAPPAGKTVLLVDESGTLGNSTSGGNITVNVTGGTINGVDNVTLTNATQVGGVYDPTTGSNVTAFRLHFPSTTTGFVYR